MNKRFIKIVLVISAIFIPILIIDFLKFIKYPSRNLPVILLSGGEINSQEIGIRNYGHRDVLSVQNDDDIYEIISNEIKNFDIIIFLGAGNITNYANLLTKKLNILKKD